MLSSVAQSVLYKQHRRQIVWDPWRKLTKEGHSRKASWERGEASCCLLKHWKEVARLSFTVKILGCSVAKAGRAFSPAAGNGPVPFQAQARHLHPSSSFYPPFFLISSLSLSPFFSLSSFSLSIFIPFLYSFLLPLLSPSHPPLRQTADLTIQLSCPFW